MAYPPATKLCYIESPFSQHVAIVLSDNNVMCILGCYSGKLMKLIDWLILARGKEKVVSSSSEDITIWKEARVKAGIDSLKSVQVWSYAQQEYTDHMDKINRENLATAAALLTHSRTDSDDTYDRHN